MANFFDDNPDLQFYFDKVIDWASLSGLVEHDFKAPDGPTDPVEAKEIYRDMLSMMGAFAADEIAPRAAAIDHKGLSLADGEVVLSSELEELVEQMNALELHGLSIPREYGGQNCPSTLYFLTTEIFSRADVSVTGFWGFYGGLATSLHSWSIFEGSTEFDREGMEITDSGMAEAIREIVRGEAFGSMDITEPDAGSDMARLRTKAEQDEDGQWLVTGQKIFITMGQGKYHVVIARSESDKEGLEALSLFLVPGYEDTPEGRKRLATVERVEDKCGHKGSPTIAVSFDRSPARLIGKRGEGFKNMLLLMNSARVSVGFESIGLCEASLRLAREYAAERVAMGKTIDRHEMIAEYLEDMQTEIQGMRALAVFAAEEEEKAIRLKQRAILWHDEGSAEAKELRKQAKGHAHKARQATPLLKYQAAEKAVEFSRLAIQIHGGVGYTKEYAPERLYRDAAVLPIYEGTSQIQALMVMKDAMGAIMKNPQDFLAQVAQWRWRSLSARDPLERRVAKAVALSLGAQQFVLQRVATNKLRALGKHKVTAWSRELFKGWDPKRDFSFAMLHAERLCKLMTDASILRLLMRQAKEFPERRELLERYLELAEPRMLGEHAAIHSRGERLLSKLRELEGDDTVAAQ